MPTSIEPSGRTHTFASQAPPCAVAGLPFARHGFEVVDLSEGLLRVKGWALLVGETFTSAELLLNGKPIGRSAMQDRPYMMQALPHTASTPAVGFSFEVPIEPLDPHTTHWLDFSFSCGNQQIATARTPFRVDLTTLLPIPPTDLMHRVMRTASADGYAKFAIECFGQLMDAALRHRPLKSLSRVLDWGCGCGRVTGHFALLPHNPEVHGCDLDGEAISWCSENLAGTFAKTGPSPPLPYDNASFDLVTGLSVLTHLTKESQAAWVAEIARIVSPNGLFVATIHGESFAAEYFGPHWKIALESGFSDSDLDPALDGIAPDGYYRATFQTREHTMRAFRRWFDVLEYVERGIGVQDLIVLRRKRRGLAALFGKWRPSRRNRRSEEAAVPSYDAFPLTSDSGADRCIGVSGFGHWHSLANPASRPASFSHALHRNQIRC